MKFELEYGRDNGSTSSTLLELVMHHDEAAWCRLVKLYAPLVYYWCRHAGLSEADCSEVGQEAFLAIHASLGQFEIQRKGRTFRGWMRTITQRRIADHFRTVAKRLPGETIQREGIEKLDDDTALVDTGASDEKRLLYHRAMQIVEGEFQPKHQEAFVLMIIEGWKAKDVAYKLGMTVNAVYLARHHILKRLKTEFAGLLE